MATAGQTAFRREAAPGRASASRRLVKAARVARTALFGALGILVALGLWYLAAAAVGQYLPPPHRVFANALQHLTASTYLRGLGLPEGGYLPHLIATTWKVLTGVGVGVVIGGASGLAASQRPVVEQITDPLIAIFGTLPILVAAPFFLIWFGIVATAQIILVALYTVVTVHIYTFRAVRNTDLKFLEYATTLGAGRRALFFEVMLPAATPEIFGGIRIAFAAAWGLCAIAELLGAQQGVGRVIVSLAAVYDVTGMMALIVLLGVVAVALDGLVVAVRSYLTRWAAVRGGEF